MRALLAALALGLVCGPLHAQPEKEPRKKEQPSAAAKQRHEEQERRRAQKQQQFDPARPQHQRARERVPGDPPPDHRKHAVSKDAQPPKGQSSPASQFQQKQAE